MVAFLALLVAAVALTLRALRAPRRLTLLDWTGLEMGLYGLVIEGAALALSRSGRVRHDVVRGA